MKRPRPIVHRLEYLAIRVIAMVLDVFPIEMNLRTARVLGDLWWRIDRRHRARTLCHLRESLGAALEEAEIERIGRACFRHWTMYAVEFFTAFRRIDDRTWVRFATLGEMRELVEILIDGRGVILLTGHYGNFELTAYLLATVGFKTTAVMRPLDNPYVNAHVVRTRTRTGLTLLDKFGASGRAAEILESGGALGFVADQDAGRKGTFVPFFGRPASTYKSIALLAMHCEVPIAVGYARRVGDGFRYAIGVERLIRPEEWRGRDDPMLWITETYTSAIESMVRAAPEQYLWLHRRWKTAPRRVRNDSAGVRGGSRRLG